MARELSHTIRRGNSGPVLLFDVDPIPSDLLSCTHALFRQSEYGTSGAVPVVGPIVAPEVDAQFRVALLPAHTTSLVPGELYVWAIELDAPDAEYRNEMIETIYVESDGL